MNWVDITILTSIAAGTSAGFFLGLIRQAIAFFGLAGGVMIAGRFYETVATFLHGSDGRGLVADANWARIIAFVGIMIVFSVVLGLLGSMLRAVLKVLFLGWLDRLLGGLLGFLMAITVTMSTLVVATVFPVPGFSDAVATSQVAHWLSGYVPVVLSMLPPEFQQYYAIMQAIQVMPGIPGIPGVPGIPSLP
ncbi:MAG: CvpA family protein [Chloroflexota bacterium]